MVQNVGRMKGYTAHYFALGNQNFGFESCSLDLGSRHSFVETEAVARYLTVDQTDTMVARCYMTAMFASSLNSHSFVENHSAARGYDYPARKS